MVKRLITSILIAMLILTGYLSYKKLKIFADIKNKAIKVSKIYGEQNPKIVAIKTTEAEVRNETLYLVFIKGNFQSGEKKSEKLEFSLTENSKKAWALTADSWQQGEIDIPN